MSCFRSANSTIPSKLSQDLLLGSILDHSLVPRLSAVQFSFESGEGGRDVVECHVLVMAGPSGAPVVGLLQFTVVVSRDPFCDLDHRHADVKR